MYKSLLSLNEKCIFENVHLMVGKMNNGTMKVVNMKFPHKSIEYYYQNTNNIIL